MALAARSSPEADLLTLAQAATIAQVHPHTVRSWCATGRLPSQGGRRRGDRRVRRVDLDRVVADRRHRRLVGLASPRGPAAGRDIPTPHDGGQGGNGPSETARPGPDTSGTGALRRLAAELSGNPDVGRLLDDVLEDSIRLFQADRVGLWQWDPRRERPLELAASRNVPTGIIDYVGALPVDADTTGLRALREGAVLVVRPSTDPGIPARLREIYLANSVATVCYVPVVFRGDPLGIIVLYHHRTHEWSADDVSLARSFGDSIAAALGNARLVESVNSLAARLRSVQDLAARLNGLQDVRDIGEAIVAEAGSLIDFDTIRIYRIDRNSGWCEPVAFQGVFMGTPDPTAEMLRVRIGVGLTGWVAEHDEALRIGDAQGDTRSVIVGAVDGPESMLLVPMSFEGRARGAIVVSRLGRDRFTSDDQMTLTIFAGYAAQALVNAERLEQLRRQRAELEHQLASQRRLMVVNERLLSTLDPSGVLELIADSLKAVVAYDALTIYRNDPERGVRRPVIARDRFAEVILGYEAPIGTGITGWAVEHREAVLANDAMKDPRSILIPGTPSEDESMIIVPLIVEGEVLGTLNIGRMGREESHFSENEFELTKLFAAQAAIALRNAETHGEVKVQAERDALTGLRNHGSFQRELGATVAAPGDQRFAVLMMDLDRFKTYNDTVGHPAGDLLLARVARAIESSIRTADRAYRYGGDEFAVILTESARAGAEEVAERIRVAVEALRASDGPETSISVGVACFPDDGLTKDALVETADSALYLAKGSRLRGGSRDPFVAALNETAGELLEGSSPDQLLRTILSRAARLLGTPHAYLYLVEADGVTLEIRAGLGLFAAYVGHSMSIDEGLAGAVFRAGQPIAIDDYATFAGRSPVFDGPQIGAVLGVPLTSGGQVVGVIGLATGPTERTWREPEVEAVNRFAQLASIALQNAQLQEAARHEPVDPVTGLPAREILLRRIDEALDPISGIGDSAAGETAAGETAAGDTAAGEAASQPPAPVTVILLDVDRFKVINESLGHAEGDRVLREVGRRVALGLGPGDVAARFGGDEFGVLLSPGDPERATRFTDGVLTELKAPFELDGRVWFISASMGLAVGRPGLSSAGDLLREAEVALVQAQADPTLRVARFDPVRSREAIERVDLEADLRGAIERRELIVHYQPIVDLRTERIVGFEALARWPHPRRGLVPPATFIPLAEETNLIIPLGAQVLELACRQARAWRERWPGERLVMSVNLSPRQFGDPGLVASIGEVLQVSGLDPSALELEITETSVMDRSEAGLRALADLRGLGVRLVLDDFGTGWSSLAYLRQLPLDTIKIDRAFVTELDETDRNVAIVQAVLSLAHGLGISVVAEGIETPLQARRLRELGCDLGQGYAWSRPLAPERIEAILSTGPGQRLLPSNLSKNRKRLTKSR
ncbi:MAG: EAL domain-containing protein [Chloroflexota bacterium]|nr:MAG: EAL domain-containing protein [Chloroflexota bacterium]